MFADSFRLVSIHCVARGLGASFLYKCPASHGSSLRQHGFLVEICERTDRQIDRQTYRHGHRSTSHSYQGRSNKTKTKTKNGRDEKLTSMDAEFTSAVSTEITCIYTSFWTSSQRLFPQLFTVAHDLTAVLRHRPTAKNICCGDVTVGNGNRLAKS